MSAETLPNLSLDTSGQYNFRDYPSQSGKTSFMIRLHVDFCRSGVKALYVPEAGYISDDKPGVMQYGLTGDEFKFVGEYEVYCLDEYTDAFVEKLKTTYPSSRIYGMRTLAQ